MTAAAAVNNEDNDTNGDNDAAMNERQQQHDLKDDNNNEQQEQHDSNDVDPNNNTAIPNDWDSNASAGYSPLLINDTPNTNEFMFGNRMDTNEDDDDDYYYNDNTKDTDGYYSLLIVNNNDNNHNDDDETAATIMEQEEQHSENNDFRSIAAHALSMLELDYQRTTTLLVGCGDSSNINNDNGNSYDRIDAIRNHDVRSTNNNEDNDDNDNNDTNNNNDNSNANSMEQQPTSSVSSITIGNPELSTETSTTPSGYVTSSNSIDTEAVRRVIENMKVRDDFSMLQTKFQKWEEEKKQQQKLALNSKKTNDKRNEKKKNHQKNDNANSSSYTNDKVIPLATATTIQSSTDTTNNSDDNQQNHMLIPRKEYMEFVGCSNTNNTNADSSNKIQRSKQDVNTSYLTRSACIAEALVRFNVLETKLKECYSHNDDDTTAPLDASTTNAITDATISADTSSNTAAKAEPSPGETSKAIATTTNRIIKLRMDVIGCDSIECQSDVTIRRHFSPIVRWIVLYLKEKHVRNSDHNRSSNSFNIELNLIGPNIPKQHHLHQVTLYPTTATTTAITSPTATTETIDERFNVTAVATCYVAVYDEWIEQRTLTTDDVDDVVDLAISFNAGIWGYNEWKSTIQNLCNRSKHASRGTASDSASTNSNLTTTRNKIPFVITAYTIQEAEDDFDVIEQILLSSGTNDAEWNDSKHSATTTTDDDDTKNDKNNAIRKHIVWEPEINMFSSKIDRAIQTSPEPGRCYYENSAWQAWYM